MSRLEQIARHGQAHVAEPDETDFHDLIHSGDLRVFWTISTTASWSYRYRHRLHHDAGTAILLVRRTLRGLDARQLATSARREILLLRHFDLRRAEAPDSKIVQAN